MSIEELLAEMPELLDDFKAEAEERLDNMYSCMETLEKDSNNIENLNQFMRETHSLKAAFKAIELMETAELLHKFEDLLTSLINNKISYNEVIKQVLFNVIDEINEYLKVITKDNIKEIDVSLFLPKILAAQEQNIPVPAPVSKEIAPPVKSLNKPITTLRVDVEKLDTGINLLSELISQKIKLEDKLLMLNEMFTTVDLSESKYQNLDPEIKGLLQSATNSSLILKDAMDKLSKNVHNIQENFSNIRMLPLDTIFSKFPRVVEELAKAQDKKVNFVIKGKETELDKTILESLADPLLHLIRNSIDHGIETVKERAAQGKIETAELLLNSYYEGNQVIIEITDEGKGIDPEIIKETALKKGLITPEETKSLSNEEAQELIFKPGFSTAKDVTDISGRGVGMDVVKSNILKLKGSIDIFSGPGKGSTFKLRIPLTLAILNALFIECNENIFALPLSFVAKTFLISREDIRTTPNMDLIDHGEETIPLLYLAEITGLAEKIDLSHTERYPVIMVNVGEKKHCILVEKLLYRAETVIKTMGNLLINVKHLTGSTIKGDGTVVLILDIPSIINTAIARVV
ncbi:chemotaxis protein CheA [Candidatus Margulisiibacteriota bacterium]